jgi:hypothetical protein
MLKTYEGGCHCGRVRFRIRVDLEKSTVGECNCSICTKKGILHIGVTPEQFELLSGANDLTTYQFNTGIAKHTFCRHCGMHPFYVPRSDPDNYSVNAHCLDDFDPVEMRPRRFFDGRNWEEAFARREAKRAATGPDCIFERRYRSPAAWADNALGGGLVAANNPGILS